MKQKKQRNKKTKEQKKQKKIKRSKTLIAVLGDAVKISAIPFEIHQRRSSI